MSTIQVRIDDELKAKSDRLFKDLGTDTTSAIRMFLAAAVAYNGFPFELKRSRESDWHVPMSEEQILQKLEQARSQAAKEMVREGEEIVSDLRGKYGL